MPDTQPRSSAGGVGRRIKQRLGEVDRSQAWLAEQLGSSQAAVSRWITGEHNPTLENMRDVALVLHRPLEWFFREDSPALDDQSADGAEPPLPSPQAAVAIS